jgi:pimeloyl-ACP methyl ester carboxylesterase
MERVALVLVVLAVVGCGSTDNRSGNGAAEGDLHTVRSRDGTTIAAQVSGSGPVLVLVHGTTADHTRWAPVLRQLAEHFTVYAMDRRGRGDSGDADAYSIRQEFEDVAALVDSIGEPVVLLGHSYGALCSLEAALLTDNIDRLVLYEPPIPVAGRFEPPGEPEKLERLLKEGDKEGVVTTFFIDVVRTSPEDLKLLQSLPNWPSRVAAAHTLPRELRGAADYVFDGARWESMKVPTLLLLGGDSPTQFQAATKAVDLALPVSRVAVMPGQQHAAMNSGPEMFLDEVLKFLRE